MTADEELAGHALVIGAGPAGLMAAETIAAAGIPVLVAEGKPSIGRKLLMAGKSGLNVTKDEPADRFAAAFGAAEGPLAPALAAFGPEAVVAWMEGLGQPAFTGSSGRVFPRAMKASPLLRAWAGRLAAQGVRIATRMRWTGWDGAAVLFDTPAGPRRLRPGATVLALGGASWARLGSDGAWAPVLSADGHAVTPFAPANMGFDIAWSPQMAAFAGTPVKTAVLTAGGRSVRGDFVVTRHGIEGGAVYALSATLREALATGPATLLLDLAPDRPAEALAARLARPRGKATLTAHLRKATGLPPVALALLREPGPLPADPASLAARIRALPLTLRAPRPLDEAISTAGGLGWAALDEGLMLRARPGTFAAGEMLDWEAPTGGYLLTACLATGRQAGHAAAAWLGRLSS